MLIFKHQANEPLAFWRLIVASFICTLLLFLIAGFAAFKLHDGISEPFRITGISSNCKKQQDYWEGKIAEAKKASDDAGLRITQLKADRIDTASKTYAKEWSWFESEIKYLEKIVKQPDKMEFSKTGRSFSVIYGLIVAILIFYIWLSRMVVLHCDSADIRLSMEGTWFKTHLWFALLMFSTMTLSEFLTSVWATEKTWFGWDSFCVTPWAFYLKIVAFVPLSLVAAAPFTLIWCASSGESRPLPYRDAKDGRFGAGRYVDFLQTWTLWLILAPSTLGVLLLRFAVEMELEYSVARMLYGIGVGLIVLLIVIRLIRNAIVLRFECNQILMENRGKADEYMPVDPTIDFLGKQWWKFPATITAALATVWALTEWLDVAHVIMGILQ